MEMKEVLFDAGVSVWLACTVCTFWLIIRNMSNYDKETETMSEEKKVLCPNCHKPIHKDELGAIVKLKEGEEGFFHTKCYEEYVNEHMAINARAESILRKIKESDDAMGVSLIIDLINQCNKWQVHAYNVADECANTCINSEEFKLLMKDLYEDIKHGDDEHREWLRVKMEEFVTRKESK